MVVSSAVDWIDVVVNGDEKALEKIDVYHEGINTKFGGKTIWCRRTLNLGNIQGVLRYRGLRQKSARSDLVC